MTVCKPENQQHVFSSGMNAIDQIIVDRRSWKSKFLKIPFFRFQI